MLINFINFFFILIKCLGSGKIELNLNLPLLSFNSWTFLLFSFKCIFNNPFFICIFIYGVYFSFWWLIVVIHCFCGEKNYHYSIHWISYLISPEDNRISMYLLRKATISKGSIRSSEFKIHSEIIHRSNLLDCFEQLRAMISKKGQTSKWQRKKCLGVWM